MSFISSLVSGASGGGIIKAVGEVVDEFVTTNYAINIMHTLVKRLFYKVEMTMYI